MVSRVGCLKAKQVRGQINKMFQVGDLIRYEDPVVSNDIPGLVVAVVKDLNGYVDRLHVQWLDREPGQLADEDTEALMLVSSARPK